MTVFRDDQIARRDLIASLEQETRRAAQLEERVRELEAENRDLRSQLAATPPQPLPTPPAGDIYLDAKLVEYIQRIIAATRDPAHADKILSGALPIDATRIADAARDHARATGRAYVTPPDIQRAARELLPSRIITRTGVSGDVLEGILALTEVL